MRKLISFFILCVFLITSCFPGKSKEDAQSENKEAVDCSGLDQLFKQMDRLEMVLNAEPFEMDGSIALLDSIRAGLDSNLTKGPAECSFVNQQAIPLKVRFEFVEPLVNRTASRELAQGMEYLYNISRLFNQDREIREFFGEEFAIVASKSPDIYMNFFNQRADARGALMNETRWRILDKEKALNDFSAIEGGGVVAAHIKQVVQ